jgi:hypothetical protein
MPVGIDGCQAFKLITAVRIKIRLLYKGETKLRGVAVFEHGQKVIERKSPDGIKVARHGTQVEHPELNQCNFLLGPRGIRV